MKKKLLSFLSLTAIAIFAFAATQSSRRAGDPVVLWSSETPVEVTWGTSVAMQDASVAADWNVGDILAITVNSFDTSKDPYPQVGFKLNADWTNAAPFDATLKDQTMPYVAKFYLTEDMLAKLKANQFFISGTAATVSKLEYIKDESGTDYSNAIWIGDYKFDGWSKFFGIDKSSFASVKEGDKIEFRLTEKGDGFILQPFLGGWSGTKINTNDDAARFSIDGNIVRLTLTADDVTALKTGGMVLQGADFTIRAIALIPMYAVNVKEGIENGTVEVDKATAAEGEEVTITATPNDGYKLASTSVRGVTTNLLVTVTNNKFKMPADAVTVSATFEKSFAAMVAAKLATVTSGEVTFTLDADYTVDAAVNVPLGKQLVIDGAGHTLTLGEATNFVLNDNITLKNVKIDATALTSPLIALAAEPAEGTKKNQDVYTDAATTDYNLLNAVTVENVMVKNLKSQFISSNGADWALENFSLTKSIIQLDATGKNFIAFDATKNNKGAIKNITISENTIYNINTTSSAYFIRFANASNAAKAFGTNGGTSTYDYKLTKNTIINTFKAQNFGNNTPNNNKVTMEATQNIYVDLKQPSKFFQGNCVKTIEKNVSWGGTEEATMSESIAAAFVSPTTALDLTAENGGIDLKPAASSLAAKYEAGDPRWKVTFVGYDVKVVNAEGITITPEVTKAAEGEKVYATYALTEGYELEKPDFVDDDNNAIEFTEGTTMGLEKVGDVEKMWIIMPAKNVTIKAKAKKLPKFYIIGDMNGWDRTAMTEMTRNEGGRYEYDYAPTTTAYFAFADYQQTAEEAAADASWTTFNSTYRYSLGAGSVDATIGEIKSLTKGVDGTIVLQPGTYKISVEPDFNAVTITGEVAPPPTEDTYVVAGAPASLFGTEWSGTAEANKMTKNTETGLYELKFTGVAFTAATTIEYKIVKNGSIWIPDGMGNNQTVSIPAAGTYDITFTFNPEGSVITGVATVATGIGIISVDGVNDIFSDGAPVYNLKGERIFKGYKGLVIKNGKKVVVK